jgi:predicted kinase
MLTLIDSLSETIAVFASPLQILPERNKYLNRQKRLNKYLIKSKTELLRT